MIEYKQKLELLVNGVHLTDSLKEHLIKNIGKFYNDDYVTTTGVMLEIGDNHDAYVTAHLNDQSQCILDLVDNKVIFTKSGKHIDTAIKIWEPSPYMTQANLNNKGEYLNYVNSHFDRARISPINGCSFGCAFCSVNEYKYHLNDITVIDKALTNALLDKRVNHVLISGGSPKKEDLPELTKVYEYFPNKFKGYDFDIMLAPRGFDSYLDKTQYKSYIQYLKDFGVKGLSINIELFNSKLCSKYCPKKSEIGLKNYIYFLECASEIFGTTAVRSGLIVGLEPIEDTLQAVELICKAGCMPMLSPYIPYNNIGKFPSVDFLLKAKEKTDEILTKYNIPLAPLCKKCKHNTL